MKASEFRDLTIPFLRALEERILAMDGDIRAEQVSDRTWMIFLGDGSHAPEEAYELYNDGNRAEWAFRGIVKK